MNKVMLTQLRALISLSLLLSLSTSARAEILVRWDRDRIPSRESLRIQSVVIPAGNVPAIQSALTQGYRIFLEVDAAALAGFKPPVENPAGVVVKGATTAKDLLLLKQRLKSPATTVLALEERGKWPHIRTNWVTANKGVLQVTSRSSQPWIENNAALLRIADAMHSGSAPVLIYPWKPITLSDVDEGPALENYLVAIAEAGSFGADLVLPLHERLQRSLLLGQPRARADWSEILRYIEFYSWNLPSRYQRIANIGVLAAEPMLSFEVMNLLTRHNLPFELIAATSLATGLTSFDVVIALDQPDAAQIGVLSEFARKGGAVVLANAQGNVASGPASAWPWRAASPVLKTAARATYRLGEGRVIEVLSPIGDPNAFAMEMRQILGREHRVIDIWNGITVLTAPYRDPKGATVLLTALNYAAQPLPVQLRVQGTFTVLQFESPEQSPTLLPFEHRDGYTEFILPGLRIGGRVFLSQKAEGK
jgi:hypothetical protein